MWRTYNSLQPVNIFFPAIKVKKGDKIILDTELKVKVLYYVTYDRGNGNTQEPIKFEVTEKTWTKLAENSK